MDCLCIGAGEVRARDWATTAAAAGGMASRATGGDGKGSSAAMCREIQRLEIAFKEPMATFKAGDLLSGSVQMDIVQEFKLKGPSLYRPITYITCTLH